MEYRGLYISTTEDCGENLGGYYCQVYVDEGMSDEIDDFCIHPDELRENPDVDYWIGLNIDSSRHYYVEDGLVPDDGLSRSDAGPKQTLKPTMQRRLEMERTMSKADFIRKCFRELLFDGEPHRYMDIVAYTREQAKGTEFDGAIEQNNLSQAFKKELEVTDSPYTRLRFGLYQMQYPAMTALAEDTSQAESIYDILDMAIALQAKMEQLQTEQKYKAEDSEVAAIVAGKVTMEHMDQTIDYLSAWVAEIEDAMEESHDCEAESPSFQGMKM